MNHIWKVKYDLTSHAFIDVYCMEVIISFTLTKQQQAPLGPLGFVGSERPGQQSSIYVQLLRPAPCLFLAPSGPPSSTEPSHNMSRPLSVSLLDQWWMTTAARDPKPP